MPDRKTAQPNDDGATATTCMPVPRSVGLHEPNRNVLMKHQCRWKKYERIDSSTMPLQGRKLHTDRSNRKLAPATLANCMHRPRRSTTLQTETIVRIEGESSIDAVPRILGSQFIRHRRNNGRDDRGVNSTQVKLTLPSPSRPSHCSSKPLRGRLGMVWEFYRSWELPSLSSTT